MKFIFKITCILKVIYIFACETKVIINYKDKINEKSINSIGIIRYSRFLW
jgi:hypothetical protein